MPLRIIVPDTCAIGNALFREPLAPNADPLLTAIRMRTVDAVAPVLCQVEFINICRKKMEGVGAPALGAPIVKTAIDEFLSLPITWEPITPELTEDAWAWYLRGVGTGDAYFAAVATAWSAEIWTSDTEFVRRTAPHHSAIYDLNLRPYS